MAAAASETELRDPLGDRVFIDIVKKRFARIR